MAEAERNSGSAMRNVRVYQPPRQDGEPLLVGQMTRSELLQTIEIGVIVGSIGSGLLLGLVLAGLAVVRSILLG